MTTPALREGIAKLTHARFCARYDADPAHSWDRCSEHERHFAAAGRILALVGEVERAGVRKCRASATSDPPQDCDMPFCGCDPTFYVVMDSLQESGWLTRQEADRLRAALAEREGALKECRDTLMWLGAWARSQGYAGHAGLADQAADIAQAVLPTPPPDASAEEGRDGK